MRLYNSGILIALLALVAPASAALPTVPVEGSRVCVYDVDAVADTDWHTVTLASFYDAAGVDGTACASTGTIVALLVINSSANAWRVKLRATVLGADTATNRLLAPANTSTSFPLRGIRGASGGTLNTIAFKKGAAGNAGQLVVVVE